MKGLTDFMKKHWIKIALGLVIVAAIGFGFKGGCTEKQERQLRDIVKIGSVGSIEVHAQVKDLCKAELLKPESCLKALPHTEKIAEIAQRADRFLAEHPKLSLENKQEILALTDDLLRELDALEGEGVIDFKYPEHRRKFLLYMAIAKSGVRVARIAINQEPVDSPSPAPSQ